MAGESGLCGPQAPDERELDVGEGGVGGVGDGLCLLLHGRVIVDGQVAVEHHHVAAADDVETARANEVGVAGDQQWTGGPRVWTVDVRGRRVGDVVGRGGEAVGRVEEEVDSLGGAVQRGGLDQGPIDDVAVEELDRSADRGDAVVRRDFLQHQRRRHDGSDAVAAGAAVAERVAVGLVHDVAFVGRGVVEAIRVDRAAERVKVGTRKWVVQRCVWSQD